LEDPTEEDLFLVLLLLPIDILLADLDSQLEDVFGGFDGEIELEGSFPLEVGDGTAGGGGGGGRLMVVA